MTQIFTDNKGRYGYRRITAELRKQGMVINHKTVMKLMKESNLYCFVRIKKYNSYRGNVGKVAPNLLNREFQAAKPNEKWVTDITEFHLYGQKIYLSPIWGSVHISSKSPVEGSVPKNSILNVT